MITSNLYAYVNHTNRVFGTAARKPHISNEALFATVRAKGFEVIFLGCSIAENDQPCRLAKSLLSITYEKLGYEHVTIDTIMM